MRTRRELLAHAQRVADRERAGLRRAPEIIEAGGGGKGGGGSTRRRYFVAAVARVDGRDEYTLWATVPGTMTLGIGDPQWVLDTTRTWRGVQQNGNPLAPTQYVWGELEGEGEEQVVVIESEGRAARTS